MGLLRCCRAGVADRPLGGNTRSPLSVFRHMPQLTERQITLGDILSKRTREGAPELYDKLENEAVRCYSCGHRCKVLDGLKGICKVRYNEGGVLKVPRGYVAALQVDPIEKKPFFHAYPGALALSFGMLGCDYHCGYCQNWVTSQALRDPMALAPPMDVEPQELVRLAKKHGARVITSTYNEPLITSEWAVDVNIPWHVTAFHEDYKMQSNGSTPASTLLRAYEIGKRAGLKFIYPGNIPAAFGDLESTHCTNCNAVVIGRTGFRVTSYRLK